MSHTDCLICAQLNAELYSPFSTAGLKPKDYCRSNDLVQAYHQGLEAAKSLHLAGAGCEDVLRLPLASAAALGVVEATAAADRLRAAGLAIRLD